MKKLFLFSALFCLLMTGCFKQSEPWESLKDEEQELYFVNQFGASMMSSYYLWNKEIASGIESWHADSDPVAKVKEIRYKDASGNDIDKWSQMVDDYAGFQGTVTGNTKSSGLEYALYYASEDKKNVNLVVTYTYKGSPAEEAGLKRGDIIVAINDQPITVSNYQNLIESSLESGTPCKLSMRDGGTRQLTAKEMYLDPVHMHKIIEKDGRKIGYLHFTSYTLKAIPDLIQVFKEFTAVGISELVLDLRYNGGGYTRTAEVLASMIVPKKEVVAGSVFERDVYNDKLAESWGEEVIKFATSFNYEDEGRKMEVSTAGANPDISKLYVIMSYGTASASESTICGLLPYMDIELIGERSRGKYCGGIIVDGPTFYGWVKDDISKKSYESAVSYTDNWGIYVMISRYADKDGNTPCMPNGFAPDLEIGDNPLDGYELGDVNETMLSVALNGLPSKARASKGIQSRPFDYSRHPEVCILTPRNIFDK